jgi:hypothetical protein
MIGFNGLGKHGRLGNQMFQYASLRGIASKHNYDWCIPPSNFSNLYEDHQLFEVFNLNSAKNISYVPSHYPLILETDFYFDLELLDNCPNNIDLGGFLQTEKYFKHIENEIRKDFTFKDGILDLCKKIMNRLEDRISIHIRRTDAVSLNECLDIEYYIKALEYFDDDIKVIVFSDDIKWCREQKIFKSDKFFISPFQNNAIDLCLMTLCSGHIIAKSSYSWWGAWLANSNKVIAPSKWFGTDLDGNKNDTRDIIPPNWIKI